MRLCWILLCSVACCAPARAQEAPLAFEVASVRPLAADAPAVPGNVDLDASDYFRYTGGPVEMTGNVAGFVMFAWKIRDVTQYPLILRQLPVWAQKTSFHVVARSPIAKPTKDQVRAMVRAFLEERFSLRLHTETAPGQAYLVRLAGTKPGPALHPHVGSPVCAPIDPDMPKKKAGDADGYCGPLFNRLGGGKFRLRIVDLPTTDMFPQFTVFASGMLGLEAVPFVDESGLTGRWDLDVEFEVPNPRVSADALPADPEFLDALRLQAGLEVKMGRAPVTRYLIDGMAEPTAN